MVGFWGVEVLEWSVKLAFVIVIVVGFVVGFVIVLLVFFLSRL